MAGQLIRSVLKSLTPNALLMLTGCIHNGFTRPNAPSLIVDCRANPTTVSRGEPVTVTAKGIGLNNPNVFYVWIGQGVTGSGETVTVDTKLLIAGNYTVQAMVKEYKSRENDQKAWRSGNCSVTFTVK